MRILFFLLLLWASPALACTPFVPAVRQAMAAFSVVEHTLTGTDAKLFLKVNFEVDSASDTLIILIDPTDGEILIAGANGPCIDGHARQQTSSVEDARKIIKGWIEKFEKHKKGRET